MRIDAKTFEQLPFVGDFDRKKTGFLRKIGERVETPAGYVLTKQFEPSHSFYFLAEGLLNFSISVEDKTDEFSVGKSAEKFTPAGWSGFRSPRRYATTVTCEKPSVLLKWSHSNLEKFFVQEPELGREFILFVLGKSIVMLNHARAQLAAYDNVSWDTEVAKTPASGRDGENVSVPSPLALLRQSPFFEIFPEKILRRAATAIRKKYYVNNERIFSQGDVSRGMDLLAYGKAALCFTPDGGEGIDESPALHLVSRPGYFVGWVGAAPGRPNDVTAVASRSSVVYHLSRSGIDRIFNRDPQLALAFAKRLLWLVSIRLRNVRAGLISQTYEREILAISNLVEQNAVQLSVGSGFHKLPYLLNSPITLGDAFSLLFRLEKEGDGFERGLSRLCLDILGKVYKEHNFLEGLKRVYQSVTRAPESLDPREIRTMAAKQFTGVFEHVPHVVRGLENLPDEPGHVFIYNHLLNHPYTTLPNHFQITLDSHFISSMILYEKYGEAGIRVVRVPRAEEYGHALYYERLGHINVHTGESDAADTTPERKRAWRKKFFKTAGSYLKRGMNIVISPEGTSRKTEESPGPFRPGAFLLAASARPESLIVPVAVANFDRRTNHSVFSLVVKKPFRISERVADPERNREKLFEFLREYEDEYRGYVREAAELARRAAATRINLRTFEQVEKDFLAIDRNLFEQDVRILERRHAGKPPGATVFYGSSSFRLWRTMSRDFAGRDVLNLGFGGARTAYCLHYFERLVEPSAPGALVFYSGDNDIGDGCLPEQLMSSFSAFYRRFRESYPEAKFTFVSIKPSPDRSAFLKRIETANGLIRRFLSGEPNAFYLNVYDSMIGTDGRPRKELFDEDGLHMNRSGYALWKKIFLANEKEVFRDRNRAEPEKGPETSATPAVSV